MFFKILTINDEELTSRVSDTLELPDGEPTVDFTISGDGSYLVAVNSSNAIVVYDLQGELEMFFLPKLGAPVTAMQINSANELFVALSDLSLFEYNLKTRKFTSFGRDLINNPNPELKKSTSVVLNISFGRNSIFLHTVSQLIVINKAHQDNKECNSSLAKSARLDFDADSNSSCNSAVNVISQGAFRFVNRGNYVYYFSSITDKQLLSVEMNPIWLMDNLPPAFKTRKFGAT